MKNYMIVNAKVVTPSEVINNGFVHIKNGIIEHIDEYSTSTLTPGATVFDAKGKWLLPGIVDLRSDAINKEIEKKRETALFSIENRLLLHGVTSVYHSVAFNDGVSEIQDTDRIISNIKGINKLKRHGLLRHFINTRYDVDGKEFHYAMMEMIENRDINMLSIFDRTYGTEEFSEDVKKEKDAQVLGFMDLIAEKAKRNGIHMASRYDDSPEKIRIMKSKGVTISELPVDIKSAEAAATEGQNVVVSAQNIVDAESGNGNMSAVEAVKNGFANILCSDNVPSSIINAVFVLHYKHGFKLYDAVNMATINPAKARAEA